jgi:hypothetical protein
MDVLASPYGQCMTNKLREDPWISSLSDITEAVSHSARLCMLFNSVFIAVLYYCPGCNIAKSNTLMGYSLSEQGTKTPIESCYGMMTHENC